MIRCATCTHAISDGHIYTLRAKQYHHACIPIDVLLAILEVYRRIQGRIQT